MTTYFQRHDSPIGELLLLSNGEALTALHITAGKYVPTVIEPWVNKPTLPIFEQTRRELDAYFKGTLHRFTLPMMPEGTEFQKQAWQALTRKRCAPWARRTAKTLLASSFPAIALLALMAH
jgi:methylated-DNA-[protein]-cysteine S-methyltransferase